MVRIERARLAAVGRVERERGLPGPGALRPGDVVLTSAATLACALLVVGGRWVPGWGLSAAVFAILAAGPPLFRWLAQRGRRGRPLFDAAASFWLVLAAPVAHLRLGPVVDAVNPRLYDRVLASMDLRLFGAHPSVEAGPLLSGWAMDVLLACYYTYFLWPVVVGVSLYLRRERAVFEQFALALTLCFTVNYFLYVMVPAVGPRFYLASELGEPLPGAVLAPYLESAMRQPSFLRDCFPSGHTAVTLLMLLFSYRHLRRLFWVMLPVGAGLVVATVAGRFHYGIDLLAAVPLAALAASVAGAVVRIAPDGRRERSPGWSSPAGPHPRPSSSVPTRSRSRYPW